MTYYELQQFLKSYGTIIYTGSRVADIDLMEDEVTELYNLGLIEKDYYLSAKLLLRKEREMAESNSKK